MEEGGGPGGKNSAAAAPWLAEARSRSHPQRRFADGN